MHENFKHPNWILPFKAGPFIKSILELLCPQFGATGYSPLGHIPFFFLPLFPLFFLWLGVYRHLTPCTICTEVSMGLERDSLGEAMQLGDYEWDCALTANQRRLNECKLVSIDEHFQDVYFLPRLCDSWVLEK